MLQITKAGRLTPTGYRGRRPPRARFVLALILIVFPLASANAPAAQTATTTTTTPPAEQAPLTPTALVGRPPKTLVNGTSPVTIELSAPPEPGSPSPALSPHVAGSWTTLGDTESFTPVSTLQPCSDYSLTVWADTTASGHARIGRRLVLSLHVACPPLAGMQQALARLGYLGAVFRPTYRFSAPRGAETRREAAVNAYHPPRGTLAPHPAAAPPVRMGVLDATTRGALVVYQADHDLAMTGEPNVSTWDSILAAETHYRRAQQPYTWVSVSESLPETLVLYRGQRAVLSTPVNTGVPGAETEKGIFPIYARYVSTTMTGTDPDGVHYIAPDVPWVNYFNGGDAVHGYPRASYGFPQSNGCVELPIETAHTVFDMLAIGDIVEVH
ncbi:MAG: L,D-transpeptidase [Solirubrobacteraceae bacterium]